MNADSVRSRRGLDSARLLRRAVYGALAAFGLVSPAALADIAGFTQAGAGPTDYTLNGNAAATGAGVPSITAGTLKSTSNVNSQATSAWFNTPQDITNWTASFVYDMGLGTANPADGVAFVVQNDPRGLTALGDGGGGLGYSGATAGVRNSVAIGYDIFNQNTTRPTRTGTAQNGGGFTYFDTGVISPASGVNLRTNPVRVDLAYRDGVITQTLTDTVTSTTNIRTFNRNLPLNVGGNTALVGFTGGTGGLNAEQFISNFTYTTGNAPAVAAAAQPITGVPHGGMGFMGVREVIPGAAIGNLAQAEAAVLAPTGSSIDYTAPHINILDTGNPGDFSAPLNPDNAYRLNSADVGGADQINNIAVISTGTVRVPRTGVYTFGVSSDDGFRLTIGGQRFENVSNGAINANGALEFTAGRGADNVTLGRITLAAGDYPIQLLNWEGTGGASLELYAAEGEFTGMNKNFNLVGAPAQTLPRRAGTVANGFEVVKFNNITDPDGAGALNALDAAITAYEAYRAGTRTPDATRTDPTIFMSDATPAAGRGTNRSGQADFGPDRNFPGDTAAGDDNFAIGARGTLSIATPGVYTFDVLSDDLFRFRITDAAGNDVNLLGNTGSITAVNTDGDAANDAFRSTSCCADRFGFYDLAAGDYTVEVIMQEGGGGASFSVFGAYGWYDYFDTGVFQLLGQNIEGTTTRPEGLQLVPEPGTVALLGAAVFGLTARRRRA